MRRGISCRRWRQRRPRTTPANGWPAISPTRPATCSNRSSFRLLPEGRRAPLICLGVFDAPAEDARAAAQRSRHQRPDLRREGDLVVRGLREPLLAPAPAHLRKGDCYQGNLTFPVQAQWSGDPLAAFDALTERQPVKYGALVALGDPDRAVALARTVLRDRRRTGMIETHPMKGTAPRGATRPRTSGRRRSCATTRRTRPRTG